MKMISIIQRWGLSLALIVAAFGWSGCGAPRSEFADLAPGGAVVGTAPAPANAAPQSPGTNTNPAVTSLDSSDILRPGDNLSIYFSDLPMAQPPFEGPIKEDGSITLLQNQTFQAAGKTRGVLEREIRERYVPRFFVTMTVTIKPQDRFYFVGGEVKSPGRQIYLGKMTVIKAIQSSGDFTDFAKKTAVELTRVDGRRMIVDCVKAQRDSNLDLQVFPGDRIHVPRSIF
jgi:polysaccharide export outer membrane protein